MFGIPVTAFSHATTAFLVLRREIDGNVVDEKSVAVGIGVGYQEDPWWAKKSTTPVGGGGGLWKTTWAVLYVVYQPPPPTHYLVNLNSLQNYFLFC